MSRDFLNFFSFLCINFLSSFPQGGTVPFSCVNKKREKRNNERAARPLGAVVYIIPYASLLSGADITGGARIEHKHRLLYQGVIITNRTLQSAHRNSQYSHSEKSEDFSPPSTCSGKAPAFSETIARVMYPYEKAPLAFIRR